jgi:septum formation protein
MGLILASSSPSRKLVLARAGIPFMVVPSRINENINISLRPRRFVQTLANRKAKVVAADHPKDVVIGCDTVVWFENQIIGKPKDEEDAFSMLRQLCGHTHYSYTGVCIIGNGYFRTTCSRVSLSFYNLTDQQIRAYLKTGEYKWKAGGYSSQEGGAAFLERINGDPSSVLGLPLSKVLILLREIAPELKGVLDS